MPSDKPYVIDKFGHKIAIRRPASKAQILAALRTHYRDFHPRAWRGKGWKHLRPRRGPKERKNVTTEHQRRFAAAARQAKREGRKGKAFARRVGELLTGSSKMTHRGGNPGMSKRGKNPGSTESKAPKLGAAWQGSMMAVDVLSPVTDDVIYRFQAGGTPDPGQMAHDIKGKVWTREYGANLVTEVATAYVDKKFGQAAALSRYSVTAWTPELYAAGMAAKEGLDSKDPRQAHRALVMNRNGYDPQTIGYDPRRPEFVAYRVSKHGGQVFRKVRTMSAKHNGIIAKVTDKVAGAILRPLGLTW